jgi:hypothetical protein
MCDSYLPSLMCMWYINVSLCNTVCTCRHACGHTSTHTHTITHIYVLIEIHLNHDGLDLAVIFLHLLLGFVALESIGSLPFFFWVLHLSFSYAILSSYTYRRILCFFPRVSSLFSSHSLLCLINCVIFDNYLYLGETQLHLHTTSVFTYALYFQQLVKHFRLDDLTFSPETSFYFILFPNTLSIRSTDTFDLSAFFYSSLFSHTKSPQSSQFFLMLLLFSIFLSLFLSLLCILNKFYYGSMRNRKMRKL